MPRFVPSLATVIPPMGCDSPDPARNPWRGDGDGSVHPDLSYNPKKMPAVVFISAAKDGAVAYDTAEGDVMKSCR